MNKTCPVCLIIKNDNEFYRDKQSLDGLTWECKSCRKKRSSDFYKTLSSDPEKSLHIFERQRAWQKKNKHRMSASKQRHRKRYPEREMARKMVITAIKKSVLTRLPCQVCGKKKSEAHHDDYFKPLDVIWFCRKHHLEHHRNKKCLLTDSPQQT